LKSCQNKHARLATLADKKTQDKVTGKESQNETTTVTDVFVQRYDYNDISGVSTD